MAAPRLDRLDKNLAINGSFDFWQRVGSNTTTVVNTGTAITADRMRIYQASANPLSVAVVRSTDVPTPSQVGMKLNYSYQVTNNTANNLLNSGAASEYYIPFNYTVEGYDYADISNGKKLVISFWFKSTLAGNYPLSLRNDALTRSYVTTFTYDVANVWQFVELIIESDSAGTWQYDNNRGLLIGMSWGGTQWQIPSLNQWTTGASVPSYLSPTAAQVVNFPNTAGAVLRITAFSIKRMDAVLGAGEFSRAGGSYTSELQLCQRYFEKSYELNTPPGGVGIQAGVTITPQRTTDTSIGNLLTIAYCYFKVRKRTSPVVTVYSYNGVTDRVSNQAGTDLAANSGKVDSLKGESSFRVRNESGGALGANEYLFHWIAEAEY